MVNDKIRKESHATTMFKYNFFVLFCNTFVRTHSNINIREDFLDFPGLIDKVGQYNWCEYVLNSLQMQTKIWYQKCEGAYYNGPSLFPILFYVDRVIINQSRTVPRTVPVFLKWDDQALKKRELEEIDSGGFGFGEISEPLVQENSGDKLMSFSEILLANLETCVHKLEKYKIEFEKTLATCKSAKCSETEVERFEKRAAAIIKIASQDREVTKVEES